MVALAIRYLLDISNNKSILIYTTAGFFLSKKGKNVTLLANVSIEYFLAFFHSTFTRHAIFPIPTFTLQKGYRMIFKRAISRPHFTRAVKYKRTLIHPHYSNFHIKVSFNEPQHWGCLPNTRFKSVIFDGQIISLHKA